MNCFYHPDREAVNTCSRCGQAVCNVCNYIIGTHPICLSCWDRQVSTPKVDVGTQPEKSERGGATKCGNHPDVDALTACSYCRTPICPECCFYDQGKPVCLKCLESGIVIEAKSPRSKKWLGLIAIVLLIVGGVFVFDRLSQGTPSVSPPATESPLPAPSPPASSTPPQQQKNEQPPYLKESGEQVHLSNNPDAKNVSFAELKSFIRKDDTSEKLYLLMHCVDFAEQVHNNAERAGIKAAVVGVTFAGEEIGHALNAFNTTDRGLVYIDCTGEKLTFTSFTTIEGKKLRRLDKPNPGERDKVAYIEKGKQYGTINIDKAESLDYGFYIEYTQNCQKMVDDFMDEADAFERALGGRTTLAEPEYSKFKAWQAELIKKAQMLDELVLFEPLGIVETVEIYW